LNFNVLIFFWAADKELSVTVGGNWKLPATLR